MKKKKPGFTLMEIIIVSAITMVILGVVCSIFITGNRVFSNSDVKSTLQIEGQVIHEQISNICMQGSDIEEVTLKNTITPIKGNEIKNISELSEINRIVINLPNEDLSKNQYIFTLSGKELIMTGPSGIKRTLSNKVKAFSFIPDGDVGAKFQVKLEYEKGFSGLQEYTLNVEAVFRNKNTLI